MEEIRNKKGCCLVRVWTDNELNDVEDVVLNISYITIGLIKDNTLFKLYSGSFLKLQI